VIPNRRPAKNAERSHRVIYDTVKKVAERARVTTHVHALRAAFAVRFDD
jgi:site-specific recombinase XerD